MRSGCIIPRRQIPAALAWSPGGCLVFTDPANGSLLCAAALSTVQNSTRVLSITEHHSHPIAQIAWDQSGLRCASIDISGKLVIWDTGKLINEWSYAYSSVDPDQDYPEIVGFLWLQLDRQLFSASASLKTSDGAPQYVIDFKHYKGDGPINTTHKGGVACVGITRAGRIKVWYTIETGFREISNDPISNLPISKASFLSDKNGSLYLVCYCEPMQSPPYILLYKVSLNFDQGGTRLPSPISLQVKITSTCIVAQSYISASPTSRLISLQLIHSVDESKVCLLAVFQNGLSSSLASRFEIINEPVEIAPVFTDLVCRQTEIPSVLETSCDIVLKEQITFDDIVVSVDFIEPNLLCFVLKNGDIQIRKSENLTSENLTESNSNDSFTPLEKMYSIFDGGFAFHRSCDVINSCLSPNKLIVTTIDSNNKITLHIPKATPSIASAFALCQRYCIGCLNSVNTDDIVHTAISNPKDLHLPFLQDVIRSLSHPYDAIRTWTIDRLLGPVFGVRILGLHYLLFKGQEISKRVFVSMHIRMVLIAFVASSKNPSLAQKAMLTKNATVEFRDVPLVTLIGPVRWAVDLLIQVIQSLIPECKNDSLALLFQPLSRIYLQALTRCLCSIQRHIDKPMILGTDPDGAIMAVNNHLRASLNSIDLEMTTCKLEEADQISTKYQYLDRELYFSNTLPSEFTNALSSPIPTPELFFRSKTGWKLDIVRKTRLLANKGLRKCSRCEGTSMIDEPFPITSNTKQSTAWIGMFKRMCPCSGVWIKI
ncbi:Mediator of RNA polymerase II transcription subunit 16 [Neolecta irregularis DAH-3]|uniref:Mediator of RNA polymerase II transcription subunit 16 n=1 Tax=Neolecta irregularis (strain DAH-3) TaxID=1198029 RepID=A0A1U7LLZ8_NEOID|nr:Mediator of RNA polymerase II transcription subunit 16 [Neolecta irregularis DAH-3]|eukprot:OLL23690.1 Mediator of RNA polymerase II transcription subunit 16 [Neolecta irregularis DAH-3]